MTGWTARTSATGIAPAAVLTLCLALGACTDDASPTAAERTESTSTATPSPDPSPSPSESAETAPKCEARERRAIARLPTWRAIDAMTGSATRRAPEAAAILRRSTAAAARDLKAACGDVPPGAARFAATVARHATRRFGPDDLDATLAALLVWAGEVGAEQKVSRERRGLRACREFKRNLGVSHRVWWSWTETGRAWWIELTFDSRLQRRPYGETDGSVRVTGYLPDRFGWSTSAARTGPGRASTEHWGGSSYDSLGPPPGISQQIVAPGIDQDVHTTLDGTFEIADMQVYFYVPGSPDVCVLPVPERS